MVTGVTMETMPGSTLEVIETEFLLELLMGLFADPSRLDRGGERLEACFCWQVGVPSSFPIRLVSVRRRRDQLDANRRLGSWVAILDLIDRARLGDGPTGGVVPREGNGLRGSLKGVPQRQAGAPN
jgi:hypothetical protein